VFAGLLTRIGAALERAALPYMVIGGQAVLVHGEPRLTRDIDIVVGAGIDGVERVLAALDAVGLRPLAGDPRAFAARTMVVPSLDEASGIRVDVILSFTSFGAQAIGRAVVVAMEGGPVRVAAPEDPVVLKVLAGRPRDLEDIRSILLKTSPDSPAGRDRTPGASVGRTPGPSPPSRAPKSPLGRP
jgi:hypothetical protein